MSTDLERLHGTLTSKHWVFKYYPGDKCHKTLLDCLSAELPHIDRDSWPERFAWGGVYVNGVDIIKDQPLTPPVMVEYYEPKFDLAEASKKFAAFTDKNVVFEDTDLIAIYKPPKLPCTQSREQRHYYAKLFVEQYLGKPVHVPSRLDTSAQGLVVMSKSKRMHRHLQQAFEKHTIEKYYVVEVSPIVKWNKLNVENQIDIDPRHPILRRVVESGGLKAKTFFKVITNSQHAETKTSILLAKPKTGRTHQLRVHTSHLGHPIVGDNFYNGITAPDLHLLCLRVKFFNTLHNKFTEIQLPDSFLPNWVKAEWVNKPAD